ncbi:VanZ family protein [bacterium]|nr:VanZ family protein [bacterium]
MKHENEKPHYLRWVILLTIIILLLSTIPGNVLEHFFDAFVKLITLFIPVEKIIALMQHPAIYSFLTTFDWLKIGHILGYSAYGLLLYRLCHCTSRRGLTIIILSILIVASIDELIQGYTLDRSSSISDTILDTSAALIAIQMVNLTKKRHS